MLINLVLFKPHTVRINGRPLISFSLYTLVPIALLALYIYILSFLDILDIGCIIVLLFIIAIVISSPPPQH